MQVLVDGYNLLFQLGFQNVTLEKARKRVMELLEAIGSRSGLAIWCIFDGKREKGLGFSRVYFGSIEVIYTADGVSADEYIIDELKRTKHPGNYLVVTSDRGLEKESRSYKSSTLDIPTFLQKYAKFSQGKEKPSEESAWGFKRLQKTFEDKLKNEEKNL